MNFFKLLWHQLYIVGVFYFIAYFVSSSLDVFINQNLISFILSGALYSIIIAGFIYLIPQSISMKRVEIDRHIKQLKIKLLH